mmetsp:Transcript_6129/g.12000  ORF Transcript_6129/g.12000 Transcript_6129/m.12000 type:complete len:257 (+) Transcript_6129:467-1237(+)
MIQYGFGTCHEASWGCAWKECHLAYRGISLPTHVLCQYIVYNEIYVHMMQIHETIEQNNTICVENQYADLMVDFGPATPPQDVADGDDGCPKGYTHSSKQRKRQRVQKSVEELGLPECVVAPGSLDRESKLGAFAAVNVIMLNLWKCQPNVRIAPGVSEGTIVLIDAAVSRTPEVLGRITSDKGGLLAFVCAAFWALAKFSGVRDLTPSLSLMAVACNLEKEHLLEMETVLLDALEWDLCGALRRGNAPILSIPSI